MNKDRIFWGSCFLLMAVLMVTNQIWGTFDIGLFKGIVTIFCIALIIRSIPGASFFGIFLPIAFILTIYREDIGLQMDTAIVWGSSVLAAMGLELIFKDAKKKLKNRKLVKKNIANYNDSNISGEHIKIKNNFGTSTKYINSDSFKTGRFENSFGEMSVYLNNVLIQNGKAELCIENSFGEMNIYIPHDWYIENHIHSVFGATTNKNSNEYCVNMQSPYIYISGNNAFGAVNIYYL